MMMVPPEISGPAAPLTEWHPAFNLKFKSRFRVKFKLAGNLARPRVEG
jgi:hypothetical protein